MGQYSPGTGKEYFHAVRLSAFRMGATPVSVKVWKEYCSAAKLQLTEPPEWGWQDDHPIVNVTWNDVMGVNAKGGFCAWASMIAGFELTLPTEAEFEYAAIGGRNGPTYPWGSKFDDSKLWSSNVTERMAPAPVIRSFSVFRNSFGLSDMSGNVWQWCFDTYDDYPYDAVTNPRGPVAKPDSSRCKRGGSFLNGTPEYFKCTRRNAEMPDDGRYDAGFRLVARP
jgi:formylglycine-generating enzyme required for sulfatase activity